MDAIAVSEQTLKSAHKGKAAAVFAEIAELGGFGKVGHEETGLDPNSTLDLTGVLEPSNKAVSEENKARIQELISAVDVPAETAETLAKAHSRDELAQMASDLGLDGNSYTNKTEMAEAIINKQHDSDNA